MWCFGVHQRDALEVSLYEVRPFNGAEEKMFFLTAAAARDWAESHDGLYYWVRVRVPVDILHESWVVDPSGVKPIKQEFKVVERRREWLSVSYPTLAVELALQGATSN